MRVLLAVDGSGASDTARELVAAIAWPAGSALRVLAVVVPPVGLLVESPGPMYLGPDTLAAIEASRVEEARRVVGFAQRTLPTDGLTIETVILHGAAAHEIVDEAVRVGADVVVVGSHGRGALGGLLLGSVSAEVIDHAPCPVLIVRRATLGRIVLALDGSTAAGQALDIVLHWPIFRALPVVVASVVSLPEEVRGLSAPDFQDQLDTSMVRLRSGLRAHAEALVAEAVSRLGAVGIPATSRVIEDAPEVGILRVAEETEADLIVVGTRGLTGLTRLRLGSTSRHVLHRANTSVLVVPPRT